jgi:hypothetical protein
LALAVAAASALVDTWADFQYIRLIKINKTGNQNISYGDIEVSEQ